MNGQKLAGILGLALRARQAAMGTDASRIMIRTGKCGLLLLDGDAGLNTRKKAEELCRQTGTPMLVLPSGMIRSATGKSNMVMAVSKGGFAEEMMKSADDRTEGSTNS